MYTFLVPTLTAVTRAPGWSIPVVLALFGIGMTVGNVVVPRLAGAHPMRGAGAVLLWGAAAAAVYPFAAHHLWTMAPTVVAIGIRGALGALLQTRLMDVAGEAQALAAALNHAAFNAANALGPWLSGLAIAAGGGWTSTGWVAAALEVGGLAMWLAAHYATFGKVSPRSHASSSGVPRGAAAQDAGDLTRGQERLIPQRKDR